MRKSNTRRVQGQIPSGRLLDIQSRGRCAIILTQSSTRLGGKRVDGLKMYIKYNREVRSPQTLTFSLSFVLPSTIPPPLQGGSMSWGSVWRLRTPTARWADPRCAAPTSPPSTSPSAASPAWASATSAPTQTPKRSFPSAPCWLGVSLSGYCPPGGHPQGPLAWFLSEAMLGALK